MTVTTSSSVRLWTSLYIIYFLTSRLYIYYYYSSLSRFLQVIRAVSAPSVSLRVHQVSLSGIYAWGCLFWLWKTSSWYVYLAHLWRDCSSSAQHGLAVLLVQSNQYPYWRLKAVPVWHWSWLRDTLCPRRVSHEALKVVLVLFMRRLVSRPSCLWNPRIRNRMWNRYDSTFNQSIG